MPVCDPQVARLLRGTFAVGQKITVTPTIVMRSKYMITAMRCRADTKYRGEPRRDFVGYYTSRPGYNRHAGGTNQARQGGRAANTRWRHNFGRAAAIVLVEDAAYLVVEKCLPLNGARRNGGAYTDPVLPFIPALVMAGPTEYALVEVASCCGVEWGVPCVGARGRYWIMRNDDNPPNVHVQLISRCVFSRAEVDADASHKRKRDVFSRACQDKVMQRCSSRVRRQQEEDAEE